MRLSALARRRADLADQSCERLLAGLGATGQPGLQLGVLDVEEALDEHEPTLVEGVEVRVQIAGEEDVELATNVRRRDKDVDELQKEMFHWVRDQIPQHVDSTAAAIDLLSIARKLERIGDLATNIAEDTIFLIEGTIVRHQKA